MRLTQCCERIKCHRTVSVKKVHRADGQLPLTLTFSTVRSPILCASSEGC